MEKDTEIIFDLTRIAGHSKDYAILLECFYPEAMEEKNKGDLAERIVQFGRYRDLNHAKDIGRKLWSDHSKDGMKELIIKEDSIPVFRYDNFKDFKS